MSDGSAYIKVRPAHLPPNYVENSKECVYGGVTFICAGSLSYATFNSLDLPLPKVFDELGVRTVTVVLPASVGLKARVGLYLNDDKAVICKVASDMSAWAVGKNYVKTIEYFRKVLRGDCVPLEVQE